MTVAEYNSKIKRILITKEEIDEKIKEAGKYIDSIYDGRPILLVSILKGAFVFMADLCRAVSVPCEIGFMCAKSYYSVEDIIDTGRTLNDVVKLLRAREPLSLKVVTLLDKEKIVFGSVSR